MRWPWLPLAGALLAGGFVVLGCGSSEGEPAGEALATTDGGTQPTRDATSSPVSADAGAAPPPCPGVVGETLTATLKLAVDDAYELYVNGTPVKEFTKAWNEWEPVTVTLNRHPSKKNVLALEARNTVKVAGMDRMVVADLSYEIDGTTFHVVSSSAWKHAGTAASDWFAPTFDDAAWAPAVQQGAHGSPPYGDVLGGPSAAAYIWSFDSSLRDVAAKGDAETVYFRRSFYVDVDGSPRSDAGSCL
jgi:hypothetical protein